MSKLWTLLLCLTTVDAVIKNNLPTDKGNNETLQIGVSFIVEDINSISLINMDYRLDYFVVYNWSVSSGQCEKPLGKLSQRNEEPYEVGDVVKVVGDDLKFFWLPEFFSPDTKKVEVTTLPGKNMMLTLAVEESSCRFKLELKYAAIARCQMDFRNYPFDEQTCPFLLRSFYYERNLVKYKWNDPGVRLGHAKYLKLNHYEVEMFWDEYDGLTVNYANHSFLRITFNFRRKISNFAVQVVCPTILIVCVAYSSFWIGVDSGPGRFLLTVLVLLSLVTMFAGLRVQLPPVSYMNGCDIWMFICMLFVFYAIMELAVVNYLDKRRRVELAKQKKKEDEQKKYIEKLRSRFETERNGADYVNFMPRGVSLIAEPMQMSNQRNQEPSRLRPFGKYQPEDAFDAEPPITGTYPVPMMNNDVTRAKIGNFESELVRLQDIPDRALMVDRVSRAAYPMAFFIFNAIFWPLLMSRRILQ